MTATISDHQPFLDAIRESPESAARGHRWMELLQRALAAELLRVERAGVALVPNYYLPTWRLPVVVSSVWRYATVWVSASKLEVYLTSEFNERDDAWGMNRAGDPATPWALNARHKRKRRETTYHADPPEPVAGIARSVLEGLAGWKQKRKPDVRKFIRGYV